MSQKNKYIGGSKRMDQGEGPVRFARNLLPPSPGTLEGKGSEQEFWNKKTTTTTTESGNGPGREGVSDWAKSGGTEMDGQGGMRTY